MSCTYNSPAPFPCEPKCPNHNPNERNPRTAAQPRSALTKHRDKASLATQLPSGSVAHPWSAPEASTRSQHPRDKHPWQAPVASTRSQHPRQTPVASTRGKHPQPAPEASTRGQHPRQTPEVSTRSAQRRQPKATAQGESQGPVSEAGSGCGGCPRCFLAGFNTPLPPGGGPHNTIVNPSQGEEKREPVPVDNSKPVGKPALAL
jgi:hypothetical protein